MKKVLSISSGTILMTVVLIFYSCTENQTLPIVTTLPVSAVSFTNAMSGGAVTDEGGASINSRGLCWSTVSDPLVTGSKSSEKGGFGPFTSEIKGLEASTTYYVRAYATNDVGTAYGENVIFTTKKSESPSLTTAPVTSVTPISAVSGGNITGENGSPVIVRGVCWSTLAAPTVALNTKTANGEGIGSFTSTITQLTPNTKYYLRSYATNAEGTGYGDELSFMSAPVSIPAITTASVSAITQVSAVSGGNILTDNGSPVISFGLCWSTVQGPTIALLTKTSNSSGTGPFTNTIAQLSPGTVYYVRAYATNQAGTGYGNDVQFLTSPATTATLTTETITSVTYSSATSGGTITNDFGGPVTSRGVCWSTSPGPTTSLSTKTNDGPGSGAFTSNLTQLTQNTTYYVRAYAVNVAGTSYGNELQFTTNTYVAPVITTSAITSVTQTSAVSGGTIIDDNGYPVTARGICWSTSPGPTTSLSTKTNDGPGSGTFTSNLTQLTQNTTYYVRAYAVNVAGTSYGNELQFNTYSYVAPAITTSSITTVTQSSAVSGGTITSDNGSPVTARGICWSTSPGPTTSLSTKTNDGPGSGTFTSNLTQLTQNTIYYVRAYAVNEAGTSYGNELQFITSSFAAPSITTSSITSVTLTSAVSGGTITNDNGYPVTARGICWSTSPGPTTAAITKTSNGTGSGNFSSSMTGLLPTTTYYVRAYATNNIGTSYGNEIVFNTKIADIDGNTYNTVKIGNQVWMAENLKTTRFNDNTAIPFLPGYSDWANISTPAYCWYNNDEATYRPVYGALYSGLTLFAESNGGKNVCPVGWHVPTDNEWNILTDYLGGDGVAGGKLKEAGYAHWRNPNSGATNESGFTALPGGFRTTGGGQFMQLGEYSVLACSTQNSDQNSYWYRDIAAYWTTLIRRLIGKGEGVSVRCIRDF